MKQKQKSWLFRITAFFLVLATMASMPITAFATEITPDDSSPGISQLAYDYGTIPSEMLDNSILRALAYLGWPVAQQKADGVLYNLDHIALGAYEKNGSTPLTGIHYVVGGVGTATSNGLPNVASMRSKGLDCVGFLTYYLTNYMPNVEGADISDFKRYLDSTGRTSYNNMWYWYDALEGLGKEGVLKNHALTESDYINKTAAFQEAFADAKPGDIIRMGITGSTTSNAMRHWAVYAGTYDGNIYIIHCGNYRGPEISLLQNMIGDASDPKTSYPLAIYRMENIWDEYGKIEVYKKDPNGSSLAGAEFLAINTEDPTHTYKIGPTNSDGYAFGEQIPFGTYTVTETKAPAGYQLTDQKWQVTLDGKTPNGTVTLNITNYPAVGAVGVKKNDDTGKALAGAVFGVYTSSACASASQVGTVTTGADGTGTLGDLKPGTYYVKEISAPANHVLDQGVYTVQVKAGETVWANNGKPIVNTRTGSIRIIKEDPHGSLGAGYVFGIYTEKSCVNEVCQTTTGEDGMAYVYDLVPGRNYYIKELALPSGDTTHVLSTEVKEVWVYPGVRSLCTVVNPIKTGGIRVIKEDPNGSLGAGYVFGIYTEKSCVNEVCQVTTGEDGTAYAYGLMPERNYYVKELALPSGDTTHLLNTQVREVWVYPGATSRCTVVNPLRTGSIGVKKTDDLGAPLAGVPFGVYSDPACKTLVDTITTDSEGKATLGGLLEGKTFYVKELAARDGYVYDGKVYSATVVYGYVSWVNSGYPVVNSRMGGLRILKTATNGGTVEGWEFAVRVYVESMDAFTPVGIYTTNANGEILMEAAPGIYEIREISNGSEYWICDTEPRLITVAAGETASVTFENQYIAKVGVNKSDDAGTPLADAVFGVYSTPSCASASLVGTLTTGADGTGVLDVQPGTYYVREISAPPDYFLSTRTYKVTVKAGETAWANNGRPIVNTRSGGLKIVKNATNGGTVEGWEFAVNYFLEDMNMFVSVGFFITNSEGEILIDAEPGLYTVVEVATGSEYWICPTDSQTVTVIPGQTATVTFVNQYVGQLGVNKGDDTAAPLAGAVFGVYTDLSCADAALIGTVTTGADGTGILGNVQPGTYYVREISAPEGYVMDETVYTVEAEAGKTVWVNGGQAIVNVRKGSFLLVKKDEWNTLGAGYVFGVYAEEGCLSEVCQLTTGEDGTAQSPMLAPGTYYIKELSLPQDDFLHELNTAVSPVEVTPGGTAEIAFVNPLRPGRISALKTDPAGNPLAGAEFLLEYSADGIVWAPVTASQQIVTGGCSSPELADGRLVTDSTGKAVFEGLHPGLRYRLTETKAPNGYLLQAEPVFTGSLPGEDLTVELTVANDPVFVLPATGSNGFDRTVTGGTLLIALALTAGWILCTVSNGKTAGDKKHLKMKGNEQK